LFDEAEVIFDEGLNVITGESGAGKSMFINALRAFITGQIPNTLKDQEGSISAFFTLDDKLKKEIKDLINLDDDELVISGNFTSKRIFFRINGQIFPKETVREIGKFLIEINSQDSNVLLRDEAYQNNLIYDILRDKYSSEFKKYDEIYKEYMNLIKKREKMPSDKTELYRKIDTLNFELDEIKGVSPRLGEDEELTEKYKALENIEVIKKNIYESMNILKDAEDINIDYNLGNVVYNLSKIQDFGFKEAYNLSLSLQDGVSDLHSMVEDKLSELEFDEEEFENVSNRLNAIMNLKRKYGPSLEDVLENEKVFEEELKELYEIKENIDTLKPKIEKSEKLLFRESENIIKKAKPYLEDMKKRIVANLKDLNMPDSDIDVKFIKLKKPNENGFYKTKFVLKTNPKSDFMDLSLIASGGELSRIFLSLETVLGNDYSMNTMLFDEVDSGVGPRMADVVGAKLKELSNKKQVIVITHMPQVANSGNRHFKIIKEKNNGEIKSNIKLLSSKEKDKEIKEMYGDIVY
jgi:DNA repair protein RecN (Recombination protein N)